VPSEREKLGPFFAQLTERPPALLFLAVRAARRAVAANPHDSTAWLRLGHAYLLLRNLTAERSSEGLLPPLTQLRNIQITTALEQAVRLDPNLEVAHRELAYLYGESNFLDQALDHRQEELRLTRRTGPRPGESGEEFAYRLESLEKDTAKLEDMVAERRQKYTGGARAFQGERLPQANLALGLGLARLAADDILLSSPAGVLGMPGIKLELGLVLSLGRADDVRSILNDPTVAANKDQFPYHDIPSPVKHDGTPLYAVPYRWPGYEWLKVLQAAAVGDYAEARGTLAVIRSRVHAGHERFQQQVRGMEHGEQPLLPGLFAGPLVWLPAFTAHRLRDFLERRAALQAGERSLRAQEADLYVLEGLLALEQGATEDARLTLAEAVKLCAQAPGDPLRFGGQPIAAGYLLRLNARARPGGS
jgi:hypothetical protein